MSCGLDGWPKVSGLEIGIIPRKNGSRPNNGTKNKYSFFEHKALPMPLTKSVLSDRIPMGFGAIAFVLS